MHWQTSSGTLSLEAPLYLGILNLTPDSFSDGGAYQDPALALAQARRLVAAGAAALDLGGESTRPGSESVAPEEEWRRIDAALTPLARACPRVPLSLDSRHVRVAAEGLVRGVAALNDVTGFADPRMLELAQESACGVIAMRSRSANGRLVMPPYDDASPRSADAAIAELRAIKARLLAAGIAPERILLDPGFGFGTTFREDSALWDALPRLPEALDWPASRFCLGVSRKRFLAWRAGTPGLPPRERDALTAEAQHEAEAFGYRVFRTHALPDPTVRPAQPADAEAIAAVHVASWRAAYRGMLPETFLESLSLAGKEALAREAIQRPESPAHRLVVLDRGGRVLGFAATGPAPGQPGDRTAELFAIYLHPSVWGRGLGRRLWLEAQQQLVRDGFAQATLWVLERNARARRFYERDGWIATGAVRTQWQSGIVMRELAYARPILELES